MWEQCPQVFFTSFLTKQHGPRQYYELLWFTFRKKLSTFSPLWPLVPARFIYCTNCWRQYLQSEYWFKNLYNNQVKTAVYDFTLLNDHTSMLLSHWLFLCVSFTNNDAKSKQWNAERFVNLILSSQRAGWCPVCSLVFLYCIWDQTHLCGRLKRHCFHSPG